MSNPFVTEAQYIITRARQSLRDGNTRDAYIWLIYLPPSWFFGRAATSLNMFDAGRLAAEFDRLRAEARDKLSQSVGWDELKHPRWPAGDEQSRGGQFAPAGSGGPEPSVTASASGDVAWDRTAATHFADAAADTSSRVQFAYDPHQVSPTQPLEGAASWLIHHPTAMGSKTGRYKPCEQRDRTIACRVGQDKRHRATPRSAAAVC